MQFVLGDSQKLFKLPNKLLMKRIKRRMRVTLKLEIATNGLTRSPRTIGIYEIGDSDRDSMSSPSIRT